MDCTDGSLSWVQHTAIEEGKMKRFIRLAGAMGAVLCMAAGAAHANRLILIPTAETSGIKAEYMKKTSGDEKAYFVDLGVSRISGEWARFDGFGEKRVDAFSAQVQVLPETTFTPAVSAGVRDISDKTSLSNGLYDGRAYYLAVSKSVPITGGVPVLFQDMKVHGGIGTGSLSGVFVGVEGRLPFGVDLSAEYDTEKVNASLSYSVIPVLRTTISLIHGDTYYGAHFSSKF